MRSCLAAMSFVLSAVVCRQAAPALGLISPASAPANAPALTLALSGSGYVFGTMALWDGTALPTAVLSTTQLNAAVPPTLLTSGPHNITIENPDNSVSGALPFQVQGTLTSVSPAGAQSGYVDPATLTATIPAAALASPGPAVVGLTI